MNKKTLITLICLFFFFYIFNYLTPMSFGDDYVYSFIWQGHSEYEPLSENAVRVSSLRDLFVSQLSHYLTWSGRTVSHTVAQFFLWLGKDIFNIFNAFVSVLLIAEIYWCAHKGKVSLHFKPGTLCWIFFVLWAFSPGFSPVFFWIAGSCNYLWTAVLLLGFLLPYIHKYYFFEQSTAPNAFFPYLMFFLGIIAGWSNENSICWIILVLFFFIFSHREKEKLETWMCAGLAGLICGYSLLMFAPGNVARLHVEASTTAHWMTEKLLKNNLAMLATVFLFQFILWYFTIRSLITLKQQKAKQEQLTKDIQIVKVLCVISFCMTAMMVFSPNFPPRSGFPGTVQLIIAACIILRIQKEYAIEIIQLNASKFLFYVGVVYFFITASFSLYGFYDYHVQMQELLSYVRQTPDSKNMIVTVQPLKEVAKTVDNASGFHLILYKLSQDEKNWKNVAFARYYGIKGIRMIEKVDGEPE